MDRQDPFNILAANNPAEPVDIDPTTVEATALLNSIITEPTPASRLLSRRTIQIAIAVTALTVPAAMAWFVTTRDVTLLAVTCYETSDLDGNRVGLSEVQTPTAAACEQPFKNMTLHLPGTEPGTVPPLTACVTDGGTLSVFPTDDPGTCEDLGLASVNPDQGTGGLDSIGAAKEAIIEYILSQQCQPLDAAETEIRIILDRHELRDWTINRSPGATSQPCASVGYGPTVVFLVPIEPGP